MSLDFIQINETGRSPGHPWVDRSRLVELPDNIGDGESIGLMDGNGDFLGCGILDRKDPCAAWRRYSLAEGVAFDESYIGSTIIEAIGRRSEEACQRLVSSDADYLPGLIVELYGDVVWVAPTTKAVQGHVDLIAEVIQEHLNPAEIVIDDVSGPRTFSGQGLKGRWIEIDELLYRIDLLNAKKPGFYLDQREQHALVGSLCEGRNVLDLFSHSGAFAMQAMRAGAERAVAVDVNDEFVKAIGANAQRNELPVESVANDALSYLRDVEAGTFDAILLDPPPDYCKFEKDVQELHQAAFTSLPPGGLLASYCRNTGMRNFPDLVAEAAAKSGREARIFAKTSQPFDFPMLLNFPESQVLSGLILQVL